MNKPLPHQDASQVGSVSPVALLQQTAGAVAKQKPDIYYIIFDEYAGFDALHSYWHDDYADSFESFLKQNHFFVATGSRSPTLNTGSEIASRLNLQAYPEKLPSEEKEQGIDDNKVMRVLKANGYTTVSIDMYFPHIDADINIQYDPEEIGGMSAGPFQKTFLDTGMLEAFGRYSQSNNPEAIQQRELILYSLDKTVNPGDIPTPKFVYTHILLPHEPFIFDEDGNLLPSQAHDDWNYYLGQYKYATKLAERLIAKLLAQADPQNPPVIILQSDHGARDIPSVGKGGKLLNNLLKDYPLSAAHDILNALYLPGFDTTLLSNDMNPTETFAIVLNHYLSAGVEVDYTPVKNLYDHFSMASPL